MAISFTFANLTANVVTVSAFLNDATDGSNTFIVRGANVPAGGALTFDTVKVALETGDSVYVYSGANNALDVIMSAMELR